MPSGTNGRAHRLAAVLTPAVPGLDTLRHYHREWLRGDLLAGVTVAAYLVPQVMAYAELAGLPATAGLWAAIGPLAVYAIFGSSRQMSIGPESTTALMTAAALAPLAAGDPARYAALAVALALLVGVICLLGWVARLGILASLLSKPVLTGYMAGIAVIMITSQLGKLTRVPVSGQTFLAEIHSFLTGLNQVDGPTVLFAGAMLAFFLISGRLAPRLPTPLLGMLLASAAVVLFSLRDHGIAVVGELSIGLPTPGLGSLRADDLTTLLLPAIGIAIVGYSDNMLTARAFADRARQTVDANQELFALGAANLAAGALHGFPVSSSGSRTVIGDALGSRSQLYSLVTLVTVLVAMFTAGPVLAAFPVAALGALVVYAALRLIDTAEFRRIGAFRRSELVLALATTVGVLGFGVLYGVLAAVGLSILDLLRRLARPHDGILGLVPGVAGMHDVDDYPDAALIPGLVIYRYDAPLCFANAEDFRHRALASLETVGADAEWFVLNAEANVEVDVTAIDALEGLRAEVERRGVVFAMARVKKELHDDLAAAGFTERVGSDRIFMTLPTAVDAYRAWHAAGHRAGE